MAPSRAARLGLACRNSSQFLSTWQLWALRRVHEHPMGRGTGAVRTWSGQGARGKGLWGPREKQVASEVKESWQGWERG